METATALFCRAGHTSNFMTPAIVLKAFVKLEKSFENFHLRCLDLPPAALKYFLLLQFDKGFRSKNGNVVFTDFSQIYSDVVFDKILAQSK